MWTFKTLCFKITKSWLPTLVARPTSRICAVVDVSYLGIYGECRVVRINSHQSWISTFCFIEQMWVLWYLARIIWTLILRWFRTIMLANLSSCDILLMLPWDYVIHNAFNSVRVYSHTDRVACPLSYSTITGVSGSCCNDLAVVPSLQGSNRSPSAVGLSESCCNDLSCSRTIIWN